MKSILLLLAIAVGAIIAFSSSVSVRADTFKEVYQVQCMAELDVLEIRLLDLADETKRQLVECADKAYAKAHDLFVPDLYVHVDVDGTDPRYGIESESFEYDMVSGHAVLTAYPEPVAGFATSAAVTLTLDDYLVVDDVPFRHCAGGAPLTGLTYAASTITDRIKLAGRFNRKEPESLETITGIRWEREPILRPDNVGYDGIHYGVHERRQFESCRYQGPGTPTWRSKNAETGPKTEGTPPPRGDKEILRTTQPVSRAYAEKWAVWKLYQVSCMPDLDFFEVRRLDFSGDDVSRRTIDRESSHPDQHYNLYVPDWHETARIVRPLYSPPDPKKPEKMIDAPPTEFECQLRSDLARFSIWSTWLGEVDGFDIMISLRVGDRLLANLVRIERCAFIGRLTYRAADRSITLDGYPPTDRFVVDDASMGLIDASIGAPTYGKRVAVFGEDPERFALNRFDSCRYVGPSSEAWGSQLY